MDTTVLGHSGIEITRTGLGTNYVGGHNLYSAVDESEGIRLVQRAVELGITFIDTADVYGLGRSEELVGRALAGRRDAVVLATKGGIQFDNGRAGPNNDPAYLREALEASLRRLGVDHVDLYYIHRPDGVTPPEEAFGALMQFKEEGLIRAAGLSNFDAPGITAALRAGPVDALQSRYNLLQREVEAEELPLCAANGITFVPWGPLAYGLLGGRYARDFVLAEDDWRHRSGAFDPDVWTRNMDIVDGLKALAAHWQLPAAHAAIEWLRARPAVGSVIAGAKNATQVEDNARSDRVRLTPEQVDAITALTGD